MLVKISNSNFWKFRENEGVGATARKQTQIQTVELAIRKISDLTIKQVTLPVYILWLRIVIVIPPV